PSKVVESTILTLPKHGIVEVIDYPGSNDIVGTIRDICEKVDGIIIIVDYWARRYFSNKFEASNGIPIIKVHNQIGDKSETEINSTEVINITEQHYLNILEKVQNVMKNYIVITKPVFEYEGQKLVTLIPTEDGIIEGTFRFFKSGSYTDLKDL